MPAIDLILLHGAVGTCAQFDSLISLFGNQFRVHRFDFEGHGTTPARERAFRIEHFIENVIEYMHMHSVQHAHLFGYSMGGYVALRLARQYPEFVESVVTLGTKFCWNAEIAAREAALLDPLTIRAKVPRFADTLAAQHTAMGWENVLGATVDMMYVLGETSLLTMSDVAAIPHRVRICVGDRDATVSLDESVEMMRGLPNGELEVWPRTAHPWQKVELARVVCAITEVAQRSGERGW
jgi:pimeloyl-ACP methyl ester carboxylesterase